MLLLDVLPYYHGHTCIARLIPPQRFTF